MCLEDSANFPSFAAHSVVMLPVQTLPVLPSMQLCAPLKPATDLPLERMIHAKMENKCGIADLHQSWSELICHLAQTLLFGG